MGIKRKKTKYNKKELQEFKKIIDAKLKDANKQLDFYLNSLKERGESDEARVNDVGDGIGSQEAERLSTLASRQRKLIIHLENAKLRIMNGVYGKCRLTGELISVERLKAVPHATLSIHAKQSQKK